MKIGIFDSGFGGLEIFRHIEKKLSKYDFVYLGDNARTPYGSRSQDTIYKYVIEAVEFLFNKGCKIIIFACNTASAEALRKVQRSYLKKNYPDRRVLGVIVPAIEEAVMLTKNRRIGIIGTESTVSSGAFPIEILKKDKKIKTYQNACPLLVPIVESGEEDKKIIDLVLEKYLLPLFSKKIDTLILGCTHYGILKKDIERFVNRKSFKVAIVSEGEIVAKKLLDYLNRHSEIEKTLAQNSKREFYTTDLTKKFEKMGQKLIGRKIKVKKINLEK